MAVIAGLLATLAAGLFTGSAVYITFVEHPAHTLATSSCAIAGACRPSVRPAKYRPTLPRS
jgi:hypothetical protein